MFGQAIIGPPGCGKTTYCAGMEDLLTSLKRKPKIINLDPANDEFPYECAIDIRDLINVEDAMEEFELGPNGAIIYCIEFLEQNFDWLEEQLKEYNGKGYFIFDCPGQVELYTHYDSMKNIFQKLSKLDFRLAAIHLVDSYYCADPYKFISALLLSLSTMIRMELPHLNVLSKIDLIEKYGQLDFNLDYYTEVLDLDYLVDLLSKKATKQFTKLNKAICELVQDFSLVTFSTLNINDSESVTRLLKKVDKCNGYTFGLLDEKMSSVGATEYEDLQNIQEKYFNATDIDNWKL
ncbi:gpn-loop gtpase 2 [Anaeramoeba flamelloides]|uniref:GPN-loop GTPase 2 n=1 Tax=Anaeramoeba flamelloides TaxID=1746091 RepID=A0ABQ8XT81_9EUKA|nr:gpn-loop gtpase 2 [Anaeramoeba flamelloides]KAJ6235827.1 gpn-loop gtpase 2 [Anaeramoeba flamelloides]